MLKILSSSEMKDKEETGTTILMMILFLWNSMVLRLGLHSPTAAQHFKIFKCDEDCVFQSSI